MTKRKVPIDFTDCIDCGSQEVVVVTDSESNEYFWEGDDCVCTQCGMVGAYLDGERGGYVEWGLD